MLIHKIWPWHTIYTGCGRFRLGSSVVTMTQPLLTATQGRVCCSLMLAASLLTWRCYADSSVGCWNTCNHLWIFPQMSKQVCSSVSYTHTFCSLRDIGTWYACIVGQNHNIAMQVCCLIHPTPSQLKVQKNMGSSKLLRQRNCFDGFVLFISAYVQGTSWCRKRCISTVLFVQGWQRCELIQLLTQ